MRKSHPSQPAPLALVFLLVSLFFTISTHAADSTSEALAAVVAFLVTGAGNAWNDYLDIEIDRAGKTWRLPTATVSDKERAYEQVYWWLREIDEEAQRRAVHAVARSVFWGTG